jgi:hypothetical protein
MNRRDCLTLFSSSAMLGACLLGWPHAMQRAAAQTGPGMDRARREKLLRLLGQFGGPHFFDPVVCAKLGIDNGGRPIPLTNMTDDAGIVRRAISRIELGKQEFFIVYEPNKNAFGSNGALIFRADSSFKRVGVGLEWTNRTAVLMSEARSAEKYAVLIRDWIKIIDEN